MRTSFVKALLVSLVVPILAGLAVACGSSNNNTSKVNTGVAGTAAAGTAVAAKPGFRIVTDVTGSIQVPNKVQRVADNWPANNAVLLMLGAGDKIVATSETVKGLPWFQKVYPRMKDIPAVFTSTATDNFEELIGAKPDVVIYSQGGLSADAVQQIKNAGIPAASLIFTDFDSLKTTYRQTAAIVGDNAPQRADDFINYLNGNLNKVSAATKDIPQNQRPKVLHVAGPNPLMIDGGNSIIDNWITLGGGINVASSINGTMKTVTIEQVLAWNPDVLIVGTSSATPTSDIIKAIKNDPQWAQVNAVKNNKIITNPKGVFFWDRYSAEEALQVLWAAKALHPDILKDVDLVAETKAFYKHFFNYTLTDDDVNRILNSEPPQ